MSTVMRQEYRELSRVEIAHVKLIKDKGQELYDILATYDAQNDKMKPWVSREASLARTHIEEAVMWAIKHLTS